MKVLCTVLTYWPCVNWKHKFSPGSSGVRVGVASYPCGLGTRLGWGETLENGHLNQQPVVVGLLMVNSLPTITRYCNYHVDNRNNRE